MRIVDAPGKPDERIPSETLRIYKTENRDQGGLTGSSSLWFMV